MQQVGSQNSIIAGWENPIGTKGFAFIEFASQDPDKLIAQMQALGFSATHKHPTNNVLLFRQGQLSFIVNCDNTGFSAEFAKAHGPCACAMGFLVDDAKAGYDKLIAAGAEPFNIADDTMALDVPAIKGIGGSALYLVDNQDYLNYFEPIPDAPTDVSGHGLTYLDHVTHNVYQGHMDEWAQFYEKLFNFREIRYFDIEGKVTGLKSRAMTSPCGKIRIPINESADDKSQIVEYLNEYKGEGIQHIALGTNDIYQTVSDLKRDGIDFLTVPDTYYRAVDNRIQDHNEDIPALQERKILIDGAPTEGQGLLLQIFTKNMLGPIFFEIIQRKGNEGFGEGNFQALFEAIEDDQIERGVIEGADK